MTGTVLQVIQKSALLMVLAVAAVPAIAADSAIFDTIKTEFELQDRDGELVSLNAFRGTNVLLAFGFTNCPHICPMIAANIARTIRTAEREAIGIFISVDTERDSPAATDNYAKKFDQNMIGLSGTYDQVSLAAKNFDVTFVVTKSEDNYTVQHTPSIFLISPTGELLDVFAMNAASAEIAALMQ